MRDTYSILTGKCSCCDSETKKTSGTAFLDDGYEALYIARWTVGKPDHGIAFLILIPGLGSFVSIVYSFETDSFTVVGEDDCDWYLSEDSMRIFERNEVIGTPLAKRAFAFLDEIWMHDLELCDFHKQA